MQNVLKEKRENKTRLTNLNAIIFRKRIANRF